MLILMHKNAKQEEIDNVVKYLEGLSLKPELLPGAQRLAIGITSNKQYVKSDYVARMPGVIEIIHVTHKYKMTSREFIPEDTIVRVGDIEFGAGPPVIIAGPCSVESEEQIVSTAKKIKDLGVNVLRGGVFKPRTSPYDFQGLGYDGLEMIKTASEETGLPICVELMSVRDIELFADKVDIFQIGARNMQNFDLLKELGKLDKPILLKRGPSALVEEFLLAAEYILDGGNNKVILCERGIRTFENSTRNILDLNSVALIKRLSHLPIIADPSHAAGRHDLVTPLAKAALAVGADGLIVEVHPNPAQALSDQKQQLDFSEFESFMDELKMFLPAEKVSA